MRLGWNNTSTQRRRLPRATQLEHRPLDQDTGSEKPPPSSVKSGSLVLGVATQLEHLPLDQDTGSEKPPMSSVLSGSKALVVATQLSHLSLEQDIESEEFKQLLYRLF